MPTRNLTLDSSVHDNSILFSLSLSCKALRLIRVEVSDHNSTNVMWAIVVYMRDVLL